MGVVGLGGGASGCEGGVHHPLTLNHQQGLDQHHGCGGFGGRGWLL
jgi:hypothetical protein